MSEKKIPKPGQNRRKSRELALKGLYSLFLGGGDIKQIADNRSEEHTSELQSL